MKDTITTMAELQIIPIYKLLIYFDTVILKSIQLLLLQALVLCSSSYQQNGALHWGKFI